MKKITLLSLATASILSAGGYMIPETSLNAVALSSANVAHASGADAAYYNPANMIFMDDRSVLSVDLTHIGISAQNYKGTVPATGAYVHDIDAESETFLVPSINYVSNKINDMRFGLSVVVPGGLTKRWEVAPAKTSAEEFSLEIVEVNPSIALAVNEKVSLALGLRMLHTSGVVKSSGTIPIQVAPSTYLNTDLSRDMEGDSIDFGYNLALAYKPTSEMEVALTYRSKIDLTTSGTASLISTLDSATYNGGTSVSVPLPAKASAAFAYTLASQTTVEFVYDRTFWSAYSELDFDYDGTISSAILTGAFDAPISKNWKDTSSYRIGVTQNLDDVTLMAGAVYDESPIPESTLSFELPDSNSLSVSLGGRYQVKKDVNVGLSALYSMREDISISNDDMTGDFSNTNILLVSAGVEYKF